MKISKILSQHRRDFYALYTCRCGHSEQGTGYDDTYFHEEVVPKRVCPKCNKTELDYTDTPTILAPKYPEGMQL